jgi:hypothetical protein
MQSSGSGGVKIHVIGVDPLAHTSPSLRPYHFLSNNPIIRVGPDGRKDGFFNKLGNWFSRNGRTTDTEIKEKADAEWEKKERENGHYIAPATDIYYSAAEVKQKNGSQITGDQKQQLLDVPEAEHYEDPIETFPMGGAQIIQVMRYPEL